jgi:hypothetical protein
VGQAADLIPAEGENQVITAVPHADRAARHRTVAFRAAIGLTGLAGTIS